MHASEVKSHIKSAGGATSSVDETKEKTRARRGLYTCIKGEKPKEW